MKREVSVKESFEGGVAVPEAVCDAETDPLAEVPEPGRRAIEKASNPPSAMPVSVVSVAFRPGRVREHGFQGRRRIQVAQR